MRNLCFGLFLVVAFTAYSQDGFRDQLSGQGGDRGFGLYPNPVAGDVVYISTEANANKDIVVYDVFGEVVLIDRIRYKALDISKLVAGVYVLQVVENQKTMTRKLVVK